MEGVKEPVTPDEFIDGIYGNAMYLNEVEITDLKQQAKDLVLTYYGEHPVPAEVARKMSGLKEVHGIL